MGDLNSKNNINCKSKSINTEEYQRILDELKIAKQKLKEAEEKAMKEKEKAIKEKEEALKKLEKYKKLEKFSINSFNLVENSGLVQRGLRAIKLREDINKYIESLSPKEKNRLEDIQKYLSN